MQALLLNIRNSPFKWTHFHIERFYCCCSVWLSRNEPFVSVVHWVSRQTYVPIIHTKLWWHEESWSVYRLYLSHQSALCSLFHHPHIYIHVRVSILKVCSLHLFQHLKCLLRHFIAFTLRLCFSTLFAFFIPKPHEQHRRTHTLTIYLNFRQNIAAVEMNECKYVTAFAQHFLLMVLLAQHQTY